MCPPIPASFLFCPCTIAIAFQRISASIRFSSLRSPGYATSSYFGIVLQNGVTNSFGTATPASRPRCRSAFSSSAAFSHSCATTSSNASIHSANSAEKSAFAGTSVFIVIRLPALSTTPVILSRLAAQNLHSCLRCCLLFACHSRESASVSALLLVIPEGNPLLSLSQPYFDPHAAIFRAASGSFTLSPSLNDTCPTQKRHVDALTPCSPMTRRDRIGFPSTCKSCYGQGRS